MTKLFANMKGSARRVLIGALAAGALMVGGTVIPASSEVPSAKADRTCVGPVDVSYPGNGTNVGVGCFGDGRYVDYGPWPGDWGAAPVQNWRWAKDGPERWWGCVGFVPTDRRFSPGDIIFNDPTCGRGSAFAAYRPGETGVFWR